MVGSEGFYAHSCRFYKGTPNELRDVGKEFIHAYNHSRIVAFGHGDDRSSHVSTFSVIMRCAVKGLKSQFIHNIGDLNLNLSTGSEFFVTDRSDGFVMDSDSLHVEVISVKGLSFDAELERLSYHIQDISEYAGPDALLHFDITNAHPEQAYMVCKLSAIYPIFSFVRERDGSMRCVLAPFPRYRVINQPTIDVLTELSSEHNHPREKTRHRSHQGFLTVEELEERLGRTVRSDSDLFRDLIADGLVATSPEMVRSPSTNRLVSQYRITENGEFMLRYVIHSRGLEGRYGKFTL